MSHSSMATGLQTGEAVHRNSKDLRSFQLMKKHKLGARLWFLPGIQFSLLAERLGHGLSLLVLFSALHHFFD